MGGAEGRRHNKTDFAHWVKEASTQPNSKAKREFYGYLQMSFGDVDVDKDGKINAQEFDYLCEKVAAMPRRFGFAPSWESESVAPSRSALLPARPCSTPLTASRAQPAAGLVPPSSPTGPPPT